MLTDMQVWYVWQGRNARPCGVSKLLCPSRQRRQWGEGGWPLTTFSQKHVSQAARLPFNLQCADLQQRIISYYPGLSADNGSPCEGRMLSRRLESDRCDSGSNVVCS